MLLREKLKRDGGWLFRWRSYMPLFILPIMLIALRHSEALERVASDQIDDIWEAMCVVIALTGLCVRGITVAFCPWGTSGRNTDKQKASTLNTTGMYSIVRHPLYLGNFLIILGVTLFVQTWWFTLITILAFWLYYERIIFDEEEFLEKKFGNPYLEWAKKTPIFLPKFKLWQRPKLPFSFKTVLKKEYTGFLGIIVTFTFLEVAGDLIVEGKLELAPGWIIALVVGLVLYITLRTLSKRTRILHVKGR